MSTSNDKYMLNWDNHLNHMRRSFDVVRKSGDFVDVTIRCDGKKLKAHKIVLSAFSSYFHDILIDNPCPHPVIILRDVGYEEMVGILEFMYLGEVSVVTENFSSFMRVAELLKVSGLADDVPEEKKDSLNEPVLTEERVETPKTGVKRNRGSFEIEKKQGVDVDTEDKGVNKKRRDASSPFQSGQGDYGNENIGENIKETETTKGEIPHNNSNVHKLLSSEHYLIKKLNPENECPICAQKFATIYLLKQHIPFHLGETKCQYCNTVVSRKDLLRKHLMAVHKIHTPRKD
nr:protein bric-a-brac 1-like [Onthophagus taurus]